MATGNVEAMAALIKRLEATLVRQLKAVQDTRLQLEAAKASVGVK